MKIQVLGTGCPKCNKLTQAVKEAVAELGLDAEIEKVTEINEIMAFGVMSTPALAIDGEVKLSGRVPSQSELKRLLQPDAAGGGAGSKSGGMKKVLIVAALLAAVVGVVSLKARKAAPPVEPAAVSETVRAGSVALSGLPKLLDLGAGKCVPCKMMEPILEELSETYEGALDVQFIDVWENREAGAQYGIRMIPTQIFYDAEGTEIYRHEGFFSKEDILAKWQELGIDLSSE